MPNRLGSRLREARQRTSIDAMAERMGVSGNTLGGYERGERLPEIDFLARFAADTGADFLELLALRLESSPERQAQEFAPKLRAPRGLSDASIPFQPAGDVKLFREVVLDIEEVLLAEEIELEPEEKLRLVDDIYAEEIDLRAQGRRLGTAKIIQLVRRAAR